MASAFDLFRWLAAPRASAANYYAEQRADKVRGLLGNAPSDDPTQFGGEGFVPGSGLLANPLDQNNIARFAAQAAAIPGYGQAGMSLLGSVGNTATRLQQQQGQFSQQMQQAQAQFERTFGLDQLRTNAQVAASKASALASGLTAQKNLSNLDQSRVDQGRKIAQDFRFNTQAYTQQLQYVNFAANLLEQAGGFVLDQFQSEALLTAFFKAIKPNEAIMSDDMARQQASQTLGEDYNALRRKVVGEGGSLSDKQAKKIWGVLVGMGQLATEQVGRAQGIAQQDLRRQTELPPSRYPAILNPANRLGVPELSFSGAGAPTPNPAAPSAAPPPLIPENMWFNVP